MQFYAASPFRFGVWVISKEKLLGFPQFTGGLCFCTHAHTLKFCYISLHSSPGRRWCLFIPCRAGLKMVMKPTEECRKNHEKERARLNDTPTAKSQWCQLLEKHVHMCFPQKILLKVPILLHFFLTFSQTKAYHQGTLYYTPKSSFMYHMAFRDRGLKTLNLWTWRGNNHCEISQQNQCTGSNLEG